MKLAFCPTCSAPLIKDSTTIYYCHNNHTYWNNPRTAVAVIFLKDGQALFSKRGIEPRKGTYDFPGGFLEYNEDVFEGAVREVQEETSVIIRPTDIELLTAYTAEYIPDISVTDLICVVRRWQGEFNPADDSDGLEWKPITFIDNPAFTAPYSGLVQKLQGTIQ